MLCYLLPSVRLCPGSLVQLDAHRGFLMSSTPWTITEKAAQTGETRLKVGFRPGALPLLPEGIQSETAHEPAAHHRHLEGHGGTQQGAQPYRRAFMPRPRDQGRPDGRFHTRAVLAAYLVEPQ